jgi:archaellin
MSQLVADVNQTALSQNGNTTAAELFIGNSQNNTSLNSDAKGYLVFSFAPQDRAIHGQTIYMQIRPEQGAPLAVSFIVSPQLAPGWSEVGT